ncbi:MAG: DNA recombination protein RmuC [Verrucomicrobium sp.]|nr:DNA recombination protein RmuC [Verrucomicrobium sp.]
MLWLTALAALLLGAAIGYLYAGRRVAVLQTRLEAAAEKEAALQDAQQRLSDSFKALSGEALAANNRSFLELAKENLEKFQEAARGDLEKRQISIQELVRPVRESLEKFEVKIGEIEKTRAGAYEGLRQHLENMGQSQERLRTETANLATALRSPSARGQWGELQLRRVVEMAGMLRHCDFLEQSVGGGENGRQRPDLIVKLPSQRTVVVDAKAPLSAYLEAIEAPNEEIRRQKLKEHARQIREHVTALSRKKYWEQFSPSPELVILFLPGEHFFGAALEHDPALIEDGVKARVLIATPTTLIALLQAVAYGWREEHLAENAQEVRDLGAELYGRFLTLVEHWNSLGKSLGQSMAAYNKATASLESRVLVSARKLKELGASDHGEELPAAQIVTDAPPRALPLELFSLSDRPEGKKG